MAGMTSFFLLLVCLGLALKAVALWKAARADQMLWFIALIVFNTVGILPLIYLLFFASSKQSKISNQSLPVAADKNSLKTAAKTKKRRKI